MTEYSKFNVIYRLQKWLDSVPGQTFMNYAYSWGASVVIAGTLFKLTHLPGANFMLFLGMGTEIFVFFLSAFDRPFDKTSDGKDLPIHVEEDEDEDNEYGEETENESVQTAAPAAGTIIFGGGIPTGNAAFATQGTAADGASVAQGNPIPTGAAVSAEQAEAMSAAASATSVNMSQWVAQQQQVSPEMSEATEHYVEELNKLTEMLSKVSEQSMRLTRDSEEMENLNRTLTGICKVYEMQLKGASAQIGTIDQINEQSRKMAAQIEQLNAIYARMIEAMTVNMRAAASNGAN